MNAIGVAGNVPAGASGMLALPSRRGTKPFARFNWNGSATILVAKAGMLPGCGRALENASRTANHE